MPKLSSDFMAAVTGTPTPLPTPVTPIPIDPNVVFTALITSCVVAVFAFVGKISQSLTDAKLQDQRIHKLQESLDKCQNMYKDISIGLDQDLHEMNSGINKIQESMNSLNVSITEVREKLAATQLLSDERITRLVNDHDLRYREMSFKIDTLFKLHEDLVTKIPKDLII